MTPTSNTDPAAANAALLAARDGAVACDLAPLRVLAVSGTDAAPFLNGQLSIEIVGLPAGACRYACFNSPKGRMLANFVVWREPPRHERFLILLPADLAPSIAKRLSMYVLRSKVTINDVSGEMARIGIGGPEATAAIASALGTAPAPFELLTSGTLMVLGLPGPRYVVLSPGTPSETSRDDLLRHTPSAAVDVWRRTLAPHPAPAGAHRRAA